MSQATLQATASYLPECRLDAADLSARTGIPATVFVERFGLRGKHVAGAGEHASDLAVAAGRRLLQEAGVPPGLVDAVVYFGSTYKEYQVWQAAPHVAHRLGCTQAFALELDYVSCGTPVALRLTRDLLLAEPEIGTVLLVAGCRESHLIDYANPRARLTFGFGDGGVAALVGRGSGHPILGSHMITDGSLSLLVKVPAGGSVQPATRQTIADRQHLLDVTDPADMLDRLDAVTFDNFLGVAEEALKRSGATLHDVDHLCAVHLKRSMHERLLAALELRPEQATYLEDTGHMSGIDPLFGLDRAGRAGLLRPGDLVLLLAAGTGYSWAATVVRWSGRNERSRS